MDAGVISDLRCEVCQFAATFAVVEMVTRPADETRGEAKVLRTHQLCSLHAADFEGYFLIEKQEFD